MKLATVLMFTLLAASASAKTLTGSYVLRDKQPDHCAPEIHLELEEGSSGLILHIGNNLGEHDETILNDLDVKFFDEGTIGYNSFGGKVRPRKAVEVSTSAGFALILYGLPVYFRDATVYKLGLFSDDKLIFKTSEVVYGFGKRLKCLYSRVRSE